MEMRGSVGWPVRALRGLHERLSLRVRLILTFAMVIAVAVMAVTLLASMAARTALTANVGRGLHDTARSQGEAVGSLLARRVQVLQALSVGKTIQDQVAARGASYTGSPADIAAALQAAEARWTAAQQADPMVQAALTGVPAAELAEYGRAFSDTLAVFVTDRYGALVAATTRVAHYAHAGEAWWQAAYNGGHGSAYIGAPEIEPGVHSLRMLFAVPVYAHGSSEVAGVLATVTRMPALLELLQQGRFGITGWTDILLPDGRMLSLDGWYHPANDAEEVRLVSGISGDYAELFFEGGVKLVSRAPVVSPTDEPYIRALGWTVVVHQDKTEGLAPVAAQERAALYTGLGALLAGTVVAVGLGRMIAQPIEELTRVARRIDAGDLSAQAPSRWNDELGVLAGSFNSMTAHLRDMVAELEQRGVERVRALRDALNAVQATLDLDMALQLIADAVTSLGYDVVVLAAYDESERKLHARALSVRTPEAARAVAAMSGGALAALSRSLDERENLAVRSFLAGRALTSGELADFAAWPPGTPAAAGLRSVAAMPLRASDGPLGTLVVLSRRAALDADELALLQTFADQTSAALDRARLFSEVREVRDRLQAVLDAVRDGVAMFDAEGRLAVANPAASELLGIDLGRYVRSGREPRLAFDDVQGVLCAEQEPHAVTLAALQSEPHVVRQRHLRSARPPQRYLDELIVPVYGQTSRGGRGNGPLHGWLAVWRDVTQQRELERAREDLTHMLVHDLRSPLGAVIGGLELAQHRLARAGETVAAAELTPVVDLALNGAHNLLDLVNSLLDIQKLESGTLPLTREPVAPAELVDDVVRELGPVAGAAGVTLAADVVGDLPAVVVDREKIRRVLVNLVDNALKFTPSGKPVTVSARRAAGAVEIAVADAGPGIPAEYRARIFDKFVQVPGSKGRRRGTGLGLAFCKLAVEAHGGRIWVECPEGGGSVFTCSLPGVP